MTLSQRTLAAVAKGDNGGAILVGTREETLRVKFATDNPEEVAGECGQYRT